MSDGTKTVLAGFCGGAVFTLVALIFAPKFWWLGFPAGFAAGYLAWEFRETVEAIPVAFGETVQAMKQAAKSTLSWLVKPHPFLFSGVILWAITSWIDLPPAQRMSDYFAGMLIFGVMPVCLLFVFVDEGAHAEKHYWNASDGLRFNPGFSRKPLTYGNTLRWFLVALMLAYLAMLKFLLFGMWRKLARGVVVFFKLIHSGDRVLCGIWGTIGGFLVFSLLPGPQVSGLAEQTLLVVCGGLGGAATSLAAKKLIQKRLVLTRA